MSQLASNASQERLVATRQEDGLQSSGRRIIDRGRGPELSGTRITVYLIFEDLRCGYTKPEIAEKFSITEDDVQLGINYISEHESEVAAEFERIMKRVNQPNPPGVDEGRARTFEELRERILGRRNENGVDDRRPL
jgi:uncharacterized protein (DUF433 family)